MHETVCEQLEAPTQERLRTLIKENPNAVRQVAKRLRVAEKTLLRAASGGFVRASTKTHLERGLEREGTG